MLLNAIQLTLPFQDPVVKFLIILLIILVIPILSDKLKIPHLLGMIIAGVVIGPYGFNLLARDSSIILFGTVGLLYIMFLAGLEIDLSEFKKNSLKSITFGFYTFSIPMILGFFAGYYLIDLSFLSSILLASMFASHTLIAYPILSKYDVVKNRAVNITVGGTMITDTLALLVLAVIVGMSSKTVGPQFWTQLSLSVIVFVAGIVFLFPIIGYWFFKRFQDSILQYIFVLTMVFLAAGLAQLAGIEGIIGAFLAGITLNRLIPHTSPLMNRVSFVGNALFIPFFLISVGMLVDYRTFFGEIETLKVAAVMTITAIIAKYSAAWLTQKTFGLTRGERGLIFGLSNAQAAATLAAVLVGYNVILGQDANGNPIRLLNDAVLNGTIVMILVTCTIATLATQRAAFRVSFLESDHNNQNLQKTNEKILITLNNPTTIDELINLSNTIKSKSNKGGLFALNIIPSDNHDPDTEETSKKLLEKAKIAASATDIDLKTLVRYDVDLIYGVTNIIREHNITDLIMGLHENSAISGSFLGRLTTGILVKSNITTYIYRSVQPIGTIRRHVVIVPPNAENEQGFPFWLSKIWNIGLNTNTRIIFYAHEITLRIIKNINQHHPIQVEYNILNDWQSVYKLLPDIKEDDHVTFLMSRINRISYHPSMVNIPDLINNQLPRQNFLLIYPIQSTNFKEGNVDLQNPSLLDAIEQIDVIGKTIAGIFRKK